MKAAASGCSYLVHAQRAERQRFAGVGVDEQHLGVQDHTVASRKRLRDELLEVSHLKHPDRKSRCGIITIATGV